MEGLGNQPDDTYITEKATYDAFMNTRLWGVLSRWQTDTVIIAGVAC